jgi:hypothetical protein
MGLYLPGSEWDGLTVKEAHRRMVDPPAWRSEQADHGAAERGMEERCDPAWGAAGQGRSDAQATGTQDAVQGGSDGRPPKREGSHRVPTRGQTTLSGFARMQVYRLLAVLAAVAAFCLAYRLGWI